MTVPAPYRGWPAAGPGRLPSGLFFWPECSQRSPESSGTSRDVRRPGLSTCAGCPAGTVALGAGGADTYTQRVIPDLTSSVSVQGSYLAGSHSLAMGGSGGRRRRVVMRCRCCHFCCHRPSSCRWVMSRTTCIFPVFGVSVRLADLPLRSATVVSVSGRLPRPDESR